MKIYCKEIEKGTFFDVPADWEVKSYDIIQHKFVTVKDKLTCGLRLIKNGFICVVEEEKFPETLQEVCDLLYKHGTFSKNTDKFIFIFYYNVNSFCVLTANENYIKDDIDCKIIEVL